MNDPDENPTRHGLDRRDLLQSAGLLGAGMALSESLLQGQEVVPPLELSNIGADNIPRKPFRPQTPREEGFRHRTGWLQSGRCSVPQ